MQVKIATTTAPTTFPAGTALGQYRFRLIKNGIPFYTTYVDAPLPAEVVFSNVTAATYTLEIVRLNSQSIPVGAAYTDVIVVAEPPPVAADAVVGAVITVI